MATTKITLNELRSIVKQIIKEEMILKEDNLEVKNIAKQLYSFLKKNGVREVSLDTSKLNIGKDSANDAQGNQIGNRDNTAKIAYFDDPKTKQSIIEVYLFGDSNKIQEIEKMLLNSFPGLGQINRELNKNSNLQLVVEGIFSNVYYLYFTVAEKTTAKGGLVGNTKQNAPQQQPVSENLRLRNYFK